MGWADYEDHAAAYNRLPLSLYSGHVERIFFKKTLLRKYIFLSMLIFVRNQNIFHKTF